MLIIPVAEKLSWKNPPVATITLIIINLLVFLILQGNDDELQQDAMVFYIESKLYDLEIPKYNKYLETSTTPFEIPEDLDKTNLSVFYFWKMKQDHKFQEILVKDLAATNKDPEYAKWKELRLEYNELQNQVFTDKYSFTPGKHKIVTLFSYMFMHGSWGHLFGNMVFLWLFGCILEVGCGRWAYLVSYITTGICAAVLYWLTHLGSSTGLVGASGAIAGLMGAYTVLFGKSRIKFFLYLGFYFNYIRLPAIILLPFWLGKEIYALGFGEAGNVAYTAHIGGMIAGALTGILVLKFFQFNKKDVLVERVTDTSSPLVEEALSYIGKLELDRGKELLAQAIENNPKNFEAYRHYFNIEKQNPKSDDFHVITKKYIHTLCMDSEMHNNVFELYKEYLSLAKPKLSADLFVTLSIIFAREGHIKDAENIVIMLLKQKPSLSQLPTALLRISEACKKNNDTEKSSKYLKILCSGYPETIEGQMALKNS